MNLKTLGVFCVGMDHFRALEAAAFAKRIEAWGYGALWFPEAVGRESLLRWSIGQLAGPSTDCCDGGVAWFTSR